MSALAFVLVLGGLALPLAWGVAAATLLLRPLVLRLGPVARAEVSAWMVVLPVWVALGFVAAVAAPAAMYGLGAAADHCVLHSHHAHLCPWHGVELSASLAVLALVVWVFIGVRLGRGFAGLVATERAASALAALGQEAHGVLVVPASVAVCHAVGLRRPRVLVSRSVVGALGPHELRAAIAHERAHLARGDLRWSAVLTLAAGVVTPSAGWLRMWRCAAEEAADDLAAAATDGPTVARALVRVAALPSPGSPGLAFGGDDLERRVLRLLTSVEPPRASRVSLGAGLMLAAVLVGVLGGHDDVHLAVERIWELTHVH